MNNRPHYAGTSSKGFSLLELLLVLVIVMLLFGAAVFEFNSMGRGASLSEGADQLESLFRFARNEAERTGKQVRIRFGPVTTEPENLSGQADATNLETAATSEQAYPVVESESNPVEMPGQFKPIANAALFTEDITELVRIESIELSGLDAQMASIMSDVENNTDEAPTENSPPLAENTFPILHFYPDGSSDSARVQLIALNPDNRNKAIVELMGYTGTVKHQLIEILPEQSSVTDTNKVHEAETSLGQAAPAP